MSLVRHEACADSAIRCPSCGAEGQPVPLETVKSLVPSFKPGETDFRVCTTPECDVVYFSRNVSYSQAHVRTPVAWKDAASPKIVCYCNRVTEEDIRNAVVHQGARTLQDVSRMTGAMTGGKCILNNPKGICCHKDVQDVLHRILVSSGSSAAPPS